MSRRVSKEEKAILSTLADLGGERFKESDITFEGTKLVIPARMTAKRAVQTLNSYIEQEEQETEFHRTFDYRPYDGAAAFERVIKNLTGMSGIGKSTFSFFGSQPPTRVSIKVGVNETLDVPWGPIFVEMFDGECNVGYAGHPEYGPLFHLSVTCPRKHRAAVEGLFKLIEEELATNSIYRGKAFDGQAIPEFVDLSGINPDEIVYSEEVSNQLATNVWSMIEHTDVHRAEGVPLKRAVLLHGPYGTGKTLAAFLTARKALEHDWTFVYCRPGKDDLHEVMQTARLYQPSVVFFEDVDTVSGETENRDNVSRLLDVFDGIKAKGTELLAVLTTNHPERIHKGMVRPGRLDAVIEIGALDSPGIEKLIYSIAGDKVGELEMDPIADAMEGFMPAFVREAIDRAYRYAIARTGEAPDKLETSDFVHAALGLRPQLGMMEEAHELTPAATLDRALSEVVRHGMDGMNVQEYNNPDYVPYQLIDPTSQSQ